MGMQEPVDEGHHVIFRYLKGIWAGAQPDPEFEGRSLNEDLGLDSLGLAELFFALSEELELPTERIVHFVRVGAPGGGDQEVANLVERIAILSRGGTSESERAILLESGVVGDLGELQPIAPHFDNVGFVVKYCNAIKSLKSAKNHDVIDADHGDGARGGRDDSWNDSLAVLLFTQRPRHPDTIPARLSSLPSGLRLRAGQAPGDGRGRLERRSACRTPGGRCRPRRGSTSPAAARSFRRVSNEMAPRQRLPE